MSVRHKPKPCNTLRSVSPCKGLTFSPHCCDLCVWLQPQTKSQTQESQEIFVTTLNLGGRNWCKIRVSVICQFQDMSNVIYGRGFDVSSSGGGGGGGRISNSMKWNSWVNDTTLNSNFHTFFHLPWKRHTQTRVHTHTQVVSAWRLFLFRIGFASVLLLYSTCQSRNCPLIEFPLQRFCTPLVPLVTHPQSPLPTLVLRQYLHVVLGIETHGEGLSISFVTSQTNLLERASLLQKMHKFSFCRKFSFSKNP